jgi:cytochrome c553
MRHPTGVAALAAVAILATGGGAGAADAEAGRVLARQCQVCHALDGRGTNPTVPNIGGQSETYLVKQLTDFREGRRSDEQMSIIAEGLDDAQIADLAAYFGAIEATFTIPP